MKTEMKINDCVLKKYGVANIAIELGFTPYDEVALGIISEYDNVKTKEELLHLISSVWPVMIDIERNTFKEMIVHYYNNVYFKVDYIKSEPIDSVLHIYLSVDCTDSVGNPYDIGHLVNHLVNKK